MCVRMHVCVYACIVDIVWVMGEADELADCIYGERPKLLNHFVNEVRSLSLTVGNLSFGSIEKNIMFSVTSACASACTTH